MKREIVLPLSFTLLLILNCAFAEEDTEKNPLWLGRPYSEWVDRLKSEYQENRLNALKMLKQQPGKWTERAIPQLIDAFKSSDESVQQKILEVLPDLPEDDLKSKAELLSNANCEHKHAFLALIRYFVAICERKSAQQAIINGLEHENLDVRLCSALILLEFDKKLFSEVWITKWRYDSSSWESASEESKQNVVKAIADIRKLVLPEWDKWTESQEVLGQALLKIPSSHDGSRAESARAYLKN